MNGFQFILMAILRMVLVLNSPFIIWSILIWIAYQFSIYKSKAQKFIVTSWQTIAHVSQHVPTAFECACEYIFFVIFTLICVMIKAVLNVTWLPITGLLWWYRFYRNLIDDANGRLIFAIFANPRSGFPHAHINEERKCHLVRPLV